MIGAAAPGDATAAAPRPRRAASGGLLVTAVAATTVAVLPVWLSGALSVYLLPDLDFDEQQLGLAVASFFLASAVMSIPAGWLTERLGARTALLASGSATVLSLLCIAGFARSWEALVALLVLSGAANGVTQPALNLALAQQVNGRRALAFGVKQSAIPLSTLLAGLAVPLVAAFWGWRGAYAVAAVLGVAVLCVCAAFVGAAPATARTRGRLTSRLPHLLWLALATGIASAAGNAMAAFLVPSFVDRGYTPEVAGLLLIAVSLGCVATRTAVGWRADGRAGGHLLHVVALMGLGVCGTALLVWAEAPLPVVSLAALLAFSLGWGWAGLFNYTIVQLNPHGPAAATGVTQAAIFGGAVIGPTVFGSVVVSAGYPTAWSLVAAAGAVAAGIVLLTRRQILRTSPSARALL